MNIDMTEKDFEQLTESSMRWAAEGWQEQADRFEVVGGGDINWSFTMSYLVGDSAAAMILAREWVKAQGFDVQVLWDTAQWHTGEVMGYTLLTDYVTATWADHVDGIVIRADADRTSGWYPSED